MPALHSLSLSLWVARATDVATATQHLLSWDFLDGLGCPCWLADLAMRRFLRVLPLHPPRLLQPRPAPCRLKKVLGYQLLVLKALELWLLGPCQPRCSSPAKTRQADIIVY